MALARDPGNDVFVELIGGADGVAHASVEAAIDAGKHVVTANKALLARHGVALARAAEEKGVSLNFEAAAAGGIPIIKTLREALAGNTVNRVYGILNGTCNYILTRMEQERLSFAECLAAAQRLGYAEADPTFDIEGHDTAHKLALLTAIAFGTEIDAESIYVEGISSITPADIEAADELGYRIKLLGVASRTDSGIEQRVHPTMVPKSSAIARIDGVTNAVAVEADFVGQLVLSGPGAGGDATASSVMSDIADIARGDRVGTFGRPASSLEPYRKAGIRRHEGGYYIRLSVYDRPGAFAAIAQRMADAQISLESIVQRRRAAAPTRPAIWCRSSRSRSSSSPTRPPRPRSARRSSDQGRRSYCRRAADDTDRALACGFYFTAGVGTRTPVRERPAPAVCRPSWMQSGPPPPTRNDWNAGEENWGVPKSAINRPVSDCFRGLAPPAAMSP